MGMRFKRSLGIAPGMRLDLTRPRASDDFGPPSGNARLRGDKLHSAAQGAAPQLSHRSDARQCGSGTSLVLLVVLGAFLVWLFA